MKTIKFMLEFEKPEKGECLSMKCPECNAPPGEECYTRKWGTGQKKGGNRMSWVHHDRAAIFMNLEVVQRGALYRIKG
jgi:hypothetical protein